MAWRKLKLQWAAECSGCGSALPSGADAWWDTATRAVMCPRCRASELGEPAERGGHAQLDRGRPGASVGREYLRRRHNRETRTLQAHPRIGPLLLALRRTPSQEKAFRTGELGEVAVATTLERDIAWPAIVLHDRRMPGGYGNIDHLAVAPAGVWAIDAKAVRGKVKVHTSLLGPPRLQIAGRERTKLLDGLDRQVEAVCEALRAAGHAGVPVQGVLCFTVADLPLLGTLQVRGHLLLHRRQLVKRLRADGPLQPPAIDVLARALAVALPSA
jgi:hypothetical protein